MRGGSRLTVILAAAVLVIGLVSAPASATFPGRRNGRIVYVVFGSNPPFGNLWSINPNGSGKVRITRGGDNGDPRWSPDGTMIAFDGPARPGAEFAVWIIRADGSHPRAIVTGLEPAWSPDGRWIAFVANGPLPGGQAIFKIRTTAPYGNPVQITHPEKLSNRYVMYEDAQPNWSTDGTTITFTRTAQPTEGTDFDGSLETVNVKTLAVHTLVAGPCGDFDSFQSPNYGPEGRNLLYAYSSGCSPASGIYQIAVGGGTSTLVVSVVNATDPAWSPTGGRQILYDDGSAISIANADGTGAHVLINGIQPDWQPLP